MKISGSEGRKEAKQRFQCFAGAERYVYWYCICTVRVQYVQYRLGCYLKHEYVYRTYYVRVLMV